MCQYGTSRQKPGNCQNRKKYHCEQPSSFHCFLLGIDLGHRGQDLGMRGGQTGLSHSLLCIPSNFWGPGRVTPAWQTFALTLAPVVPAGGCRPSPEANRRSRAAGEGERRPATRHDLSLSSGRSGSPMGVGCRASSFSTNVHALARHPQQNGHRNNGHSSGAYADHGGVTHASQDADIKGWASEGKSVASGNVLVRDPGDSQQPRRF